MKQMLNVRQGGELVRQAMLERICMVMLGKSRCSWEKDEVGNKIGLMSTGPILGRGRQGWAVNSGGGGCSAQASRDNNLNLDS